MGLDFVAVDFETANPERSSACAMGVAFVRDGRVTHSTFHLIRPPSQRFTQSWVHGLSWEDVRNAPSFEEVWRRLRLDLKSEILVAHNAAFDRDVLAECLQYYGIRYKVNPFLCSMRLCKEAFRFRRFELAYICKRLNIPLQHHQAESDAKAAARIAIRAAGKMHVFNANRLIGICGS